MAQRSTKKRADQQPDSESKVSYLIIYRDMEMEGVLPNLKTVNRVVSGNLSIYILTMTYSNNVDSYLLLMYFINNTIRSLSDPISIPPPQFLRTIRVRVI